MATPPTGTVTFLFTDIEGSTRLAQQYPAAWPAAKACHHAILENAIASHRGYVFQIIGDAFCATFHTAADAVAAALDAQRALIQAVTTAQQPNGQAMPMPIRVRMGIHTGTATLRPDGQYEGYLTLVRVQRIMSVAHGGQVLMSREVADLVMRDLPDGAVLHDLGAHRLKDLSAPEQLHQLAAPGLPADFPPLKTADHLNNLPAQLTSFIGREAEMAAVRQLLAGTRLLTLVGAGGVGKTRLALQVATDELAAFPDGVWFIELAPLADPALIANTIGAAAGVREEPNRTMLATLGDHFRVKTALVILDNCEHLIASAAQACDALLHAAPHLKIIATSREVFDIAGEHVYRVPSLAMPAPQARMPAPALAQVAALRLFAERARAAKSDFALTDANVAAVAQICRRLDGIPLAIELAAARVKALSPEQIAARLDDRFRVLTGGSRTALPRQQTLRALIDWSYRLLSEPEKTLLRRLSVFAGGWTLEAAEAVCADDAGAKHSDAALNASPLLDTDILDLLSHLVDKSLVAVDEADSAMRYRMLESVRQFAREALDSSCEGARLRDRHLAHFAAFAEAAGSIRRDPAMQILAIMAELDNLRAAMTWASEDRAAIGLRLIDGIAPAFLLAGNCKETYDWLISFLRRDTGGATSVRADALRLAGFLAVDVFNHEQEGWGYYQESLAIGRALGDKLQTAWTLAYACIVTRRTDPAAARAQLEEALQLALDAGEPAVIAIVENGLGELWRFLGDDARAAPYYERSLEGFRAVGRKAGAVMVLINLASLALHRGDGERARMHSRESLALAREADVRYATVYGLSGLAGAAALGGQPAVAARLFGAATAVRDQLKITLEENDRADFDHYLALAHAQAEPAAFEVTFAEGYALSLDEAIEYALNVSCD